MRFADKTTVYIPTRLFRKGEVSSYVNQITTKVGGVTLTEVRGAYVMESGELVTEPVTVVAWWHRKQEPSLMYLSSLARWLLVDGGEESVLVEFFRERATTARLILLDEQGEVSW